jgi:outer membrane protein OmpA-like peptidoglycan-associated protein
MRDGTCGAASAVLQRHTVNGCFSPLHVLSNFRSVLGLGRLFAVLLLISGGYLHAQTAAEMDALLESSEVSFAQAARFTLVTADVLDERSSVAGAYALAREKGWFPAKAQADSPIKLGELCFLVMNAFNIKGSFLYALFPGPRYAFRELDYLKLVHGRRDPAIRVSGESFLRILGGVMGYVERERPKRAEQPAVTAEPERPAVTAEREQVAELILSDLEQHEIVDTTVRVEEEGIVISLNNIQFLPDSTELTEVEKTKIREIAMILSRYPGKLLIGGHSAMAGTEEGQLQISRERAAAVAAFLTATGVRLWEDITIEGYGAQRPLGDNATAEGQALNRRVEIILLDE